MDDIEDLLLCLEEEIAAGKKTVFGNSVVIDPAAMFSIIERIREALPESIKEAKYILATGERRRQEDAARAKNMLQAAQLRANEILSDHTIVLKAQQEAQTLRYQADEYCEKVLNDARRNLARILDGAEKTLSGALDSVLKEKSRL
jgi:cell division septum initiation protein DivIVA